jgi:O-antigen/teichoic acid export membrane protein
VSLFASKGHTVRAGAWSTLESIANQAIQVIVFVTVARFTTPSLFGIAVLAATLPTVGVNALQAISQAVVQSREADPAELSAIHRCTTRISLWLSGAIAAAAYPFAALMDAQGHLPMFLVGALAPLFAALGVVSEGLLTRNINFRVLAMRRVGSAAGAGIIGVGITVGTHSSWGIIAYFVTSTLLASLSAITLSRWTRVPLSSTSTDTQSRVNALFRSGFINASSTSSTRVLSTS